MITTYDEIDNFSKEELESYIVSMEDDYNESTYIFDYQTEIQFEKLNYAKLKLTEIASEPKQNISTMDNERTEISIATPNDILNTQTIHRIYDYFKEHFALEPKIVTGDHVDLITILKEHNAKLNESATSQ